MLTDLKKGKAALQLVPKLELRLSLEKTRTKLLASEVVTADKIAKTWETAARQQAEARVRSRSWYRSPYLWFVFGTLLGVGASVGIAAGFSRFH